MEEQQRVEADESGTTHTHHSNFTNCKSRSNKAAAYYAQQQGRRWWRSPICHVLDAAADGGSGGGTEETVSVVQIPDEGWYAFCFGTPSFPFDQQQQEEETTQPQQENPSSASRRPSAEEVVQAVLCIEEEPLEFESDAATKSIVVRIQLPLPTTSGHQEKSCGLRNFNVGKLLFLTRGAKLTVVSVSASSEVVSTTSTTNNNTSSNQQCSWCVIFHHSLHQEQQQQQKHNNRPGIGEHHHHHPSVGTLSSHKKSLVCRYCVRSFSSPQAALHHVDSAHSNNNKTTAAATTTMARAKKRQRNGDGSMRVGALNGRGDGQSNHVESSSETVESDANDIWTRPLPLLFEDDVMAVINKPQGMAIMGTKPCLMRCDLLMALRYSKNNNNNNNNKRKLPDGDEALRKPRPVHRLDAATGGVLVVAKTRRAETALKASFAQRQCHKRYRAIVLGKLQTSSSSPRDSSEDRGVIDVPISGKPSQTLFRPVRYVPSVRDQGWLTLVDLWPVTGRRHQLRKHMKELGHPILGDRRHGGRQMLEQEPLALTATSRHLCLWAMEITLPHPITGEEQFFGLMQDPTWLDQVLQLEEHAWKERQDQPSTDANLTVGLKE